MAESETHLMNADEPFQQGDIMLSNLHLLNDHHISFQLDGEDVSSIAQSLRFSDNISINSEASGGSYIGVGEHLAGTPRNIHKSGLHPRIGWQAISILLATALVVLVFLSFIAFLWFATINNMIWHRIMVKGWANKAVTISSTIIRTACSLQAGIAAAMLAGLVLESSSVLLVDAAQVSIVRAGNSQPLDLLLPILQCVRRKPREASKLGVAGVVLLVTTTTLLQFNSTVLLSDLHLGPLPGLPLNSSLAYDWGTNSIARVTTWIRNPAAYPTFAEFSDPLEFPTDVDDTGTLLRAFLPFADARSRETLANYSGDALILDSRVSCQRPRLTNISLTTGPDILNDTGTDPGNIYAYYATLNGSFTLSSSVTRLLEPLYPVPFSCIILLSPNVTAVTICQLLENLADLDNLNARGGLVPEFGNFTEGMNAEQLVQNSGIFLTSPYIVIETSNQSSATAGQVYTTSNNTLNISGHGPWTDLQSQITPFNFSISVCYSAFTTATLEVNFKSRQNRTEPITKYNPMNGYYTTPDIHLQMVEYLLGTNSGYVAIHRGANCLLS
jgi:hypothetical protein